MLTIGVAFAAEVTEVLVEPSGVTGNGEEFKGAMGNGAEEAKGAMGRSSARAEEVVASVAAKEAEVNKTAFEESRVAAEAETATEAEIATEAEVEIAAEIVESVRKTNCPQTRERIANCAIKPLTKERMGLLVSMEERVVGFGGVGVGRWGFLQDPNRLC